MSSILDKLKADRHKADMKDRSERETAHARYVELLTADEGGADAVRELGKLMDRLGIDAEVATKDRNLIAQAQSIAAEITKGAGTRFGLNRLYELRGLHNEYIAKVVRELEEAQRRLDSVYNELTNRAGKLDQAYADLVELRAQNGKLLALVDMPPKSINGMPVANVATVSDRFVEWQREHPLSDRLAEWLPAEEIAAPADDASKPEPESTSAA